MVTRNKLITIIMYFLYLYADYFCLLHAHLINKIRNTLLYEARHDKTCSRGFRPGLYNRELQGYFFLSSDTSKPHKRTAEGYSGITSAKGVS